MKISKVILSCLFLSVIFAAIATELSMRVSTNEAMTEMQHIDTNEEDFSNWYGDSEITPEQLKEQIEIMQNSTSFYQYPGYWHFWLQVFLRIFMTAFLVSLIQSIVVLRMFKKTSSVF